MTTELRNLRLAAVADAPAGDTELRAIRLAVVAPDPAYGGSGPVTGGTPNNRMGIGLNRIGV